MYGLSALGSHKYPCSTLVTMSPTHSCCSTFRGGPERFRREIEADAASCRVLELLHA